MDNCTKQARLFFGTRPIGVAWKFGKLGGGGGGGGGLSNGPVVLLSSISLVRFECIVSGFLLVLCKFRDSLEI